jgi:aryl-alcohol dehydrogenase-like predicted oxidoreductase
MNRTRRCLLLGAAGLLAPAPACIYGQAVPGTAMPLLRKKIPSSGEEIPVVGLGTARRYEQPGPGLRETLARFGALGGTVVDTAPVYGDAEAVVGNLVAELRLRPALFLATKVSISGREAGVRQIEQSFRRLRTPKIDLIAVHNLRDTQAHLATLRELKRQERIRYAGINTESFIDSI